MTRALTPRDIDAFQRDGVVLILGAFGPDRHDIFSEPMQPGDALIFSAWIIHAAPSNTSERTRAAVSTRWLGDDVRWRPHPAADPSIRQEDLSIEPGELARADDVFPVAWMRTTSR